jgi:copper transport protein
MHFYVFDSADGRRLGSIEEMQVELTQPEKEIGPLQVRVSRAGPGHYVATRADIGVPGDWELLIRLRLSEFDVYSARLPVEIR